MPRYWAYIKKMNKLLTFKIVPYDSSAYHAAVALGEEILRKPLGLAFSLEELAQEKDYVHIAGFWGDDLCATALLIPQGDTCRMRRVAVRMPGQGIGSAMMQFCENYARAQGFREIYCHARATAVNFYLKNNYVPEGDYFIETTIPHLKMRKVL